MTTQDYKQLLKLLIDTTNNEALLKHWKKQLERDIQHQEELELSMEEWNMVEEGIAEYNNGAVISLEEFITKRK
jgi:sulfur relay (sulfurtransferase) DsrC/TusE family protein